MKPSDLSPKAANALLYLAFAGGKLPLGRLDPKFRKELVDARWIEVKKIGNKAGTLHLVERGWAAIADEFPELPKSGRKPTAGKKAVPQRKAKPTTLGEVETLNAVLATLRAAMNARKLTLVDILTPNDPNAAYGEAHSSNGTAIADARVLEAYFALAGSWSAEVRLSTLRGKLADIPRAQVDAAIERLWDQQRLTAYAIDTARVREPEDEAAAVTLGATKHHYIRIKGA